MSATSFKTENNTYRKLIGNGLTYRIPRFQRDYSWTEGKRSPPCLNSERRMAVLLTSPSKSGLKMWGGVNAYDRRGMGRPVVRYFGHGARRR
ncbi:hypothetical protein FJZ55_04365 [Candidatus Woesearchaeota archaeon]|nr:hypothetical protein [Candidatus Woesearchaeota archaeon]